MWSGDGPNSNYNLLNHAAFLILTISPQSMCYSGCHVRRVFPNECKATRPGSPYLPCPQGLPQSRRQR